MTWRGGLCVFRALSDSDSDFYRTPFQFLSDSVPISAGHRSDSYRTVFRADVGQFWGTIGMVPDRIGRVSEMARNGVRQKSESGIRRSGATLEWVSG